MVPKWPSIMWPFLMAPRFPAHSNKLLENDSVFTCRVNLVWQLHPSDFYFEILLSYLANL